MKLNLQMLSKIISLPVEKEHNHFTSAELFNNTDFVVWHFLDVQYFSTAV